MHRWVKCRIPCRTLGADRHGKVSPRERGLVLLRGALGLRQDTTRRATRHNAAVDQRDEQVERVAARTAFP
jgi:hypothetical protein